MSAQLQAWRKQCEDLIAKPIEWTDAGQGYLTCPFSHLHTKKTGSRDTVLYIDGGFPQFSACTHAARTDCGRLTIFLENSWAFLQGHQIQKESRPAKWRTISNR